MKELESLTPLPDNPKDQDDAADKEKEFPLTLEELREKRKEMARLRVKESYRIAKAKRMSKIKSKKFHRLMKRDKIRQQMKDFEALQKTDPEAALKQLEVIERTRVEERSTLRHKNTGTWAKNLQVRAKYDKDVRQQLAGQLAISRELTQKQNIEESSDEELEIDESNVPKEDPMNPWTRKKSGDEISEFVSGYRKYWMDCNENTNKMKEHLAGVKEEEDFVADDEPGQDVLDEDDSETEDCNDMADGDQNDEQEISILSRSGVWQVEDIGDDENSDSSDSDEEVEVKYEGTNPKRNSEKSLDEIFDNAEDLLGSEIEKKLRKIRHVQQLEKDNEKKWRERIRNRYVPAEPTGIKTGLEFPKINNRAELDEEFNGDTHDVNAINKLKSISIVKESVASKVSRNSNAIDEIDPNNFISIKPKFLKTNMSNTIAEMDDAIDDNDDVHEKRSTASAEQKLTIAEAFEEDDILADFELEKEEEKKKNEITDVDQNLPGWGSWAGFGIIKRPNKHFIVKFPKAAPRKDDNKGSVIINEELNKEIRKHLVSDLPFPFTSVSDFEASIRAPLGTAFVPETAHKVLVQPSVVTKMGAIIEPMDENMLVQTKTAIFGKKERNRKNKNGRNTNVV